MKKLTEKVLSSQIVFKGNYLWVIRDQVELSNGHQSFREYIKHAGAAMVIPLLNPDKVLMIHQYRHSVGQIFLEFPAGKCDSGESTGQTAARELQEEVGLRAGKMTLLTHIHPVIGYSNEKIDLFLAENLISVPQTLDPDEMLELEEISIKDLETKIWNNEITDVKTQIGAHWLFRHLRSQGTK